MADNNRRQKGSGTIVKEEGRKSSYKVRIQENGKTKSKFFSTEKEAKQYLNSINKDAKKKESIITGPYTFGRFAPIFFKKKKQTLKPSSYSTLVDTYNRLSDIIDYRDMRTFKDADLQEVMEELLKKNELFSASIIKKAYNLIVAMLKRAAALTIISSIPVFDYAIPTENCNLKYKVKDNWLNDKLYKVKDADGNEIKTSEMLNYEKECLRYKKTGMYTKNYGNDHFLQHPAGPKLLLLLHTGLRLGEALALEWPDYDEDSKTLSICKNVVMVTREEKDENDLVANKSRKIFQDSTKTVTGERVIILNKAAIADLELLRKQFDEQTKIIEERKQEELKEAKIEFGGSGGNLLKAKNKQIEDKYREILQNHKYICGSVTYPYASSSHMGTLQTHRRICQLINLQHTVTVHGLRHTYVTHYYNVHSKDPDFDIYQFSRSIGHASVRTTMEIYAHLEINKNRNISRTMDDLKDF